MDKLFNAGYQEEEECEEDTKNLVDWRKSNTDFWLLIHIEITYTHTALIPYADDYSDYN